MTRCEDAKIFAEVSTDLGEMETDIKPDELTTITERNSPSLTAPVEETQQMPTAVRTKGKGPDQRGDAVRSFSGACARCGLTRTA